MRLSSLPNACLPSEHFSASNRSSQLPPNPPLRQCSRFFVSLLNNIAICEWFHCPVSSRKKRPLFPFSLISLQSPMAAFTICGIRLLVTLESNFSFFSGLGLIGGLTEQKGGLGFGSKTDKAKDPRARITHGEEECVQKERTALGSNEKKKLTDPTSFFFSTLSFLSPLDFHSHPLLRWTLDEYIRCTMSFGHEHSTSPVGETPRNFAVLPSPQLYLASFYPSFHTPCSSLSSTSWYVPLQRHSPPVGIYCLYGRRHGVTFFSLTSLFHLSGFAPSVAMLLRNFHAQDY